MIDSGNRGEAIPFVRPPELDASEPITSASMHLSAQGASYCDIVPAGSVLVCCIGSLGKVGFTGVPVAFNQQINALVFDESRVDSRFGFQFCRTLRATLESMAPATTLPIVNKRKFSELCIPLPPVPEQKRIAAILDKADAIRRRRQEAARFADTLIPSVFYEMFGDPGTNPKRWPVKPLASICPIAGEYGSGAASTPHRSGLPRYIRITDIDEDGRLRSSSVAPGCPESEWEKYVLADGDVLFARSGATVGKTYLYSSRDGLAVFAGYLIRFRPNPKIMLPVYLYSFTRTVWYNDWVQSKQRVVAQPNINATQYGELTVPIAPLDLQRAFAARVLEINVLSRTHADQAREADQLFNALVQRAFRGEL
jgi:type I restriction enzyme S subunit